MTNLNTSLSTIINTLPIKSAMAVVMLTTAVESRAEYWNYQYDSYGRITQIDGPRLDVGDITAFSYGDRGELLRLTTAAGHIWRWGEYNNDLLPGLEVDPNGIATRYTYDNRQRLVASLREPPDGPTLRSQFEYDAAGKLVTVSFPDGTSSHYAYDTSGRLIAVSNGSGDRVEFELDLAGNPLSEIIVDQSGTVRRSLFRQYDELSRELSGHTEQGDNYAQSYDKEGKLISRTDGRGNTAVFGYDELGRLSLELSPLNQQVEYVHGVKGVIESITDPRGLKTDYQHSGLGNTTGISSPDTGVSNFGHDAAGNTTMITDARGVTANISYDVLNRPVLIDYANDLHDIRVSYDAGDYGVGYVTGIEDGASRTVYTYHHSGNVARMSVDYGDFQQETVFARNSAGKLSALTYPSGGTLQYEYDASGEVVALNWLSNGESRSILANVEYLPFGPVQAWTMGNGIALNRQHDLSYRLVQQTASDGLETNYQYDANNNITTIDGHDFEYDAIDRLVVAGTERGAVSYEYDEVGNRVSYSIKRNDITYEYDVSSNRLLRNSLWDFEYTQAGNVSSKLSRDASGEGIDYAYDDHGRLAEINRVYTVTTGKGRQQITEMRSELTRYRYNALGQRIAKLNSNEERFYVYGLQGELLAEADGSGEVVREYVYLRGSPVAVLDYSVNTDDRPGQEALVADEDHADAISTGPWIAQRSKKAFQDYYLLSADSSSLHRWQLNDLEPGEYEIYARWPGSKKHTAAASFLISHALGEDELMHDQTRNGNQWNSLGVYTLSGFGRDYIELGGASGSVAADAVRLVKISPAPGDRDGKIYFVHPDHLGTPQRVTNSDQRQVWAATYTPFGLAELEIEELEFNLRFPGQYYDAESGLHYNYFRDYDPSLGRYIQSDPIGLAGGINTYGYVFQNPIRYTDPTGAAVPAFLVACLANPVCTASIATAARGSAGGLIGGLSAFNELATDPCFYGDYLDSVLAGSSFGFFAGALPGGGSLAAAALRGGGAASFGNAVSQYTKNDGIGGFILQSNVVATGIGSFAAGLGNVAGLFSSLGALRSGASLNQALTIGASEGSAVSTLAEFAGNAMTFGFRNNSDCPCKK